MRSPTTWLMGIGDASSQWWGWALCYTDHRNQSISGKAADDYITGKREWPYRAINKAFFWQKNHCMMAWEADEERAHYEIQLKASRREHYGEHFND